MKKLLLIFIFLSPLFNYSQTLIKKEDNRKLDLETQEKIFSSNAGYCKIYKINSEVFILWNGYSVVERTTIINREILDELVRAASMIKDAEYGDIVKLETIKIKIKKARMIGTIYYFTIFKTNTEYDLSDLTYSEISEMAKTSNIKTVESKGEKVIDKVKVIESENEENWLSLSKGQLQKLIDLRY